MNEPKKKWTDSQPVQVITNKRYPILGNIFNPPSEQIKKLKEQGKWMHED